MGCQRLLQKLKMTPAMLRGPALGALLLAAGACSTETTATPVPTPAPAATAGPTATPSRVVRATPAPSPTPPPTLSDYWNPPTDFYGEPVYGGTLRVNYEDPLQSSTVSHLQHANVWGALPSDPRATNIYRIPTGATLVMENPYDAYGPVIPDLARSWTIHDSQDGVTFHFRDDATWHNGKAFSCEDARFTIETIITGHGLTFSNMAGSMANVVLEEMVCRDDMTLEINFTEPTAIPLHSLANHRAIIFNKAWFLAGGEEAMFQDVSMGIGPFKWSQGQRVTGGEVGGTALSNGKQSFERNPDYFIPELPYVDELIVYHILDAQAQQAAHLAHQTDWKWIYPDRYVAGPRDYQIHGPRISNWDEYRSYVEHNQIVTVVGPTQRNLRLWINAQRPPFDNVRIRQAIVMGIDREAAIRTLADGHAAAGGFSYAPGSPWELPRERLCSVPGWCVAEDMEDTRAQARAILAEEGFDFDRTYAIPTLDNFRYSIPSDFLRQQLELLGIEAELDFPDWRRPPDIQDFTRADFGVEQESTPDDNPASAPSHYMSCDSPLNDQTSGWACAESIEKLLDRVRVEANPERHLALAHEIELAALKQYSSFPVYWEQEAAAFWPEVRGYVHFPNNSGSFLKFVHLWIDPAHAGGTIYTGQVSGVPGGT